LEWKGQQQKRELHPPALIAANWVTGYQIVF
jgi:hypothetical protein